MESQTPRTIYRIGPSLFLRPVRFEPLFSSYPLFTALQFLNARTLLASPASPVNPTLSRNPIPISKSSLISAGKRARSSQRERGNIRLLPKTLSPRLFPSRTQTDSSATRKEAKTVSSHWAHKLRLTLAMNFLPFVVFIAFVGFGHLPLWDEDIHEPGLTKR